MGIPKLVIISGYTRALSVRITKPVDSIILLTLLNPKAQSSMSMHRITAMAAQCWLHSYPATASSTTFVPLPTCSIQNGILHRYVKNA